jgi:hypothetical protein
LSTASDYLRQQQSVYVGSIAGGTTVGEKTRIAAGDLPYILAPVPHTGDDNQFAALYIPRGKALWAAVEQQSPTDQAVNAPLLGVQGGYY